MDGWDKAKLGQIIGILLSALLALAAVYGYDVKVIQPREAVEPVPLVVERGMTNFNDLSVDSVTATGAVSAGSVSAGSLASAGPLIQGTKAVTLTAGLQISPAYSLYLLSSTGAVSMTLAAPTAPGQVLYLYGDDANTITVNDTNIRSTDGNAVTIGQYDIVEFMSTSAEWIHVAKSADS